MSLNCWVPMAHVEVQSAALEYLLRDLMDLDLAVQIGPSRRGALDSSQQASEAKPTNQHSLVFLNQEVMVFFSHLIIF